MIFKRLFTPPYQHPDPDKRIRAIDDLSPQKPADKSVLHELAFNDSEVRVSLAALRRLNSFALWQKVAKTSSHESLRKEAHRQVEKAVLSAGEDGLSENARAAFLLETASTDLIVQALEAEPPLVTNDDVIFALLEKVSRPGFTVRLFFSRASDTLQQRILSSTDDETLLQKLYKKADGVAVAKDIAARLEQVKAARELPLQIERQTTLVLSKYLALLEKSDYAFIRDRQAEYEYAFKEQLSHFSLLSTETRETLLAKHERIAQRADSLLARLKPEFDAQAQARAQAALMSEVNRHQDEAARRINALYENPTTASMEDVAQTQAIIARAAGALKSLSQYEESDAGKKAAGVQSTLEQQFDRFPAQQNLGAAAEKILEQMRECEVDTANDEALGRWASLKSQWKEALSQLDTVPKQWTESYSNLAAQWREATRARDEEKSKQQKVFRREMSIIDTMIDNGKYRGAMKRFSRLSLPTDEKAGDNFQDRKYQLLKERIARLEGWQAYIAAPRKPALIEEAKQLIAQPAVDILARADAIKTLRQQWLSLGESGEADEVLQKAEFDDLLEQAFEPCRIFYAAQEAQRTKAKQEREQILSSLLALETDLPMSQLLQETERLRGKWHQCGHTEASDYRKLKKAWDAAMAVHQDRLQPWLAENRAKKQSLIDDVKALQNESSVEVRDQAIALQSAWKDIGHAGNRYESKLWQAFRKENDILFGQLKDKQQQQQSEESALFERLKSELSALADTSVSETEEAHERARQVLAEGENLRAAQFGALKKAYGVLIQNWKAQQGEAQEHARSQARESLKAHVVETASQDGEGWGDDEMIGQLPRDWRLAFTAPQADDDRHELTIMLEIMLSEPGPAEDTSARQTLQLSMLAGKLQDGEALTPESLAKRWLRCGAPVSQEMPLCERFVRLLEHLIIPASVN